MTVLDYAPAKIDLAFRFGDDLSIELYFVDSASVALDVSAWSFAATLDSDDASVTSVALTVTHGATGYVTFSALAAAITEYVAGTAHRWEILRGDTNRTLIAGGVLVQTDEVTAP